MPNRRGLAILTIISNIKGVGPGHSAIVAGNDIYTFEELAGAKGDSWVIVNVSRYLKQNEHRPVVVQELNDKVSFTNVMQYLMQSIQHDDDYGTSGVCSSQVASAIDAGTLHKFNPTRIDTPREVYVLAKNQGLVKRSYYIWPGSGKLGDTVRYFILERLEKEYADVTTIVPSDGIMSW